MSQEIKELVDITSFANQVPELVQGAGGNTSVKSDGNKVIHIKASGFCLSELNETTGHLALDLAKLLKIVDDTTYDSLDYAKQQERSAVEMKECCVEQSAIRPSLETGFHAILDKYVVHTHPVYVNALTCMEESSRVKFLKILESKIGPILWIAYRPPGHPLATLINSGLKAFKAQYKKTAQTILLENHGLITTSDNIQEVKSLHTKAVDACTEIFGRLNEKDFTYSAKEDPAVTEKLKSKFTNIRFCADTLINFTLKNNALEIDEIKPLVPDDAVYWGSRIIEMETSSLTTPEERQGIIVTENSDCYVFAAKESLLTPIEDSFSANIRIRLIARNHAKISSLTGEQIAFITGMEGEKYRQALGAKTL